MVTDLSEKRSGVVFLLQIVGTDGKIVRLNGGGRLEEDLIGLISEAVAGKIRLVSTKKGRKRVVEGALAEAITDLKNKNPRIREKYPTIKIVGKWWDKIVADTENGKPLSEEKYGPLKRVRRRYMEWTEENYQPSVTVENLTLEKLWQ